MCHLKISIQSGCAPACPGRIACILHGSSMTHAFGPYSARIFFSASSRSINVCADSSLSKSIDDRRTRAWYVPETQVKRESKKTYSLTQISGLVVQKMMKCTNVYGRKENEKKTKRKTINSWLLQGRIHNTPNTYIYFLLFFYSPVLFVYPSIIDATYNIHVARRIAVCFSFINVKYRLGMHCCLIIWEFFQNDSIIVIVVSIEDWRNCFFSISSNFLWQFNFV